MAHGSALAESVTAMEREIEEKGMREREIMWVIFLVRKKKKKLRTNRYDSYLFPSQRKNDYLGFKSHQYTRKPNKIDYLMYLLKKSISDSIDPLEL